MSFLYTNWIFWGKKTHKNKTPGVNLANSSWGSMMSVLLPPPAGKQIMKLAEITGLKKLTFLGNI